MVGTDLHALGILGPDTTLQGQALLRGVSGYVGHIWMSADWK